MPNVYLCASIANAQVNSRIGSELRRAGFEVFDPCTIHPRHTDKIYFPEQVFAACRQAIERCDVLLVFLDSYGKDSAWEIGFARGLGKYVVGIVAGSSLFLQDWMVKFTVDHILILEGSWFHEIVESPEWASIRDRSEMAEFDQIAPCIAAAFDARKCDLQPVCRGDLP
jgi:hypothetical protein